MVGSTVGKYRIVEQLGKGGMGTVYRAIDETLDREVAIKALNADLLSEESLQRFRSEAVLLAKLSHSHIAGIYELTRQGNELLMVMEYVKGETCEKLLARTGPLPVPRAIGLCDQILDALEHAHASGIVHRDLKPGNVMVTASGDVKVMDFGIARVAGSAHLTMDGYMMGTPAYMAPEQVRGEEVDRRMDLYSAAVMLYRLVTSRLPFEAESPVTLIHSQLSDPPTPPRQFRPDLPEWIDSILARGLAKSPADRFQTAAEFRKALDNGLAGTLTQLRPALDDDAVTMGPTPTPTALRRVATIAAATPVQQPQSPQPSPTGFQPEATVTLRKPQLAMAGGLLALLVVGVGILAYAALRRPSASATTPTATSSPSTVAQTPLSAAGPVPAPAPDSSSTPGAPPATTPASTSASAATSPAPPPPAPAPIPAGTSTAASTSASAATPVAAAPSAPAGAKTSASVPTPPPPAAPASSAKAAPKSAPTTQPAARSNGSSAPATGAAGSATAPDASGRASAKSAPGATPAAPAAPALPPESFGDVKTIVGDGAKTKEIDALLNLESDKLVVRNREDGSVVQSAPYKALAAATYAHAKGPRWQDGDSVAPVPKNFGGSGFFLKSSKHWLTLQSKSEFIILRLEDKNVRAVMTSVETRTGLKVQRNED